MGCAREGADVLFYLSGTWPNGRWRGWDLLRRRIWRNPYLFHDTIGKRWARLVTCRRFCAKVQNVNDPGEPMRMWCFKCEREDRGQSTRPALHTTEKK